MEFDTVVAKAKIVGVTISNGLNWISKPISGWIGMSQSIVHTILLVLIAVWVAGLIPVFRYRKFTRLAFWLAVGAIYVAFTWLGI